MSDKFPKGGDKFPKGKVKVKLYIYEEPDFMPTPFYVTSLKYESPVSPYLGEVEVEFTFPEISSKEERLKQLDKTLEEEKNRHKEVVERLENMKEQLKGEE